MTAQATGAVAERAELLSGPSTFVLSDAGSAARLVDTLGPATPGSDGSPVLGAAPGADVLDRVP